MDNPKLNKRVLFGAGIIVILATLSFLAYFFLKEAPADTTEKEKEITLARDIDAQRVFIKDFHTFDNSIHSEARFNIERRLYMNTVMNDQLEHGFDDHGHGPAHGGDSTAPSTAHPPDLYTGTIRADSFSDTSSGNNRTIAFLVDIEPVNLTYQVRIFIQKNNNHETRNTIITCAPDELSIDASVVCKQGVV